MARLELELVPSTSWGDNVRSRVSRNEWDRLRRRCYQNAGYRCELCSGQGSRHPVEAHEVWSYDDVAHVQTLVRLIALCPLCHQSKHIGRTLSVGPDYLIDAVLLHIMKVNGWSPDECQEALDRAFYQHAERSQFPWTVDITWILEGR